MRKIIFVICFLSVSAVLGDTRVLDFLYQVRSNNSEASLRFEEINQNARNLELERALSEIENITNSPLEISSLSGLNRAKAKCNVAIMKTWVMIIIRPIIRVRLTRRIRIGFEIGI